MTPNELFGNQQNTEFVTFEEIENAFKTPTQRQADYEPKPDANPPMGDLGHLADPTGEAFHDFERLPDETDPVDHDHAMRTGERIARVLDAGIDFTLSNFVAHNDESYKADERDLQDIAECWGELAEEKGWSIGPEWSLIILYIMVYGPLVKQAITDRRLALIEAQQAAMQAQQEAMQAQLNTLQQQQAKQPPTPQQTPLNNGDAANPNNTSPFVYQPAN